MVFPKYIQEACADAGGGILPFILYYHFFYGMSDWVEILWGVSKFFSKQMLKISAFYLEKQKSGIIQKEDQRQVLSSL